MAVVKGPYRMLVPLNTPQDIELYDRAADRTEQQNVAEEQPEIRDQLQSEVDRYLTGASIWGDTPEVELDEMRLEQLRALGYVIKQ